MKSTPRYLLALLLFCVLAMPVLRADEPSKIPRSPETGLFIKFVPAIGGAFGKTKPGYYIHTIAGKKAPSEDSMVSDSKELNTLCIRLGRGVIYQGVWIVLAPADKYSKSQTEDFEDFKNESTRFRFPVYTCLESDLPNWKKVE